MWKTLINMIIVSVLYIKNEKNLSESKNLLFLSFRRKNYPFRNFDSQNMQVIKKKYRHSNVYDSELYIKNDMNLGHPSVFVCI